MKEKVRKCKKCGKEINSSTKQCLNCGKDQRFFLFRHPFLYAFILVIALLAIFTGRENKAVDITEEDILEKKSISTELIDVYDIGDIFVNGKLDVKYVFKNPDFKRHGQYAHVSSQHEVVKADFEFQNASITERLITSNEFKCFADDKECKRFYNTTEGSFTISLPAGKKIVKSVYFEIPAEAKEVIIRYETPFAKDGYVDFKVK